ncbi:Neutral ceramidase [Eumeta japonica]|uniref:Neutral ceramidase n=1 Tax=Eumeta variegata TaxID=151549 RepID=A0A4C1YPB6_EUMVA|nr:Neutral ceramidase [Eumeta japonica]
MPRRDDRAARRQGRVTKRDELREKSKEGCETHGSRCVRPQTKRRAAGPDAHTTLGATPQAGGIAALQQRPQESIKVLSKGDRYIRSRVKVAGHPRNNLRHGRWYAAVERLESRDDDSWLIVATDADWETRSSVLRRDSELPTISKNMKNASERFFSIAANHPNPLISVAPSYESPPASHFIRRPRNVVLDPPDDFTSKVENRTFIWERSSKVLGTSYAEVRWEVPPSAAPGAYRLHHYGSYKYVLGGVYPYDGFSDTFQVA